MRLLCALAEIPDGDAKAFAAPPGEFVGIFAVRRGDAVQVWRNSCPHLGTPLDWAPDEFLDATGNFILCATHGALFRLADGFCVKGPCSGESLEPIACEVRQGEVFVA